MRMTISRQLIGGFLGLALLVLIAGLVGIFVLKRVSTSADTVAKEKAPIQYAVMNAALAVDIAEKHTIEYVGAVDNLDKIGSLITTGLAEFEMWVTILEYGTESDDFLYSPAGKLYQGKNNDLIIPRSSEEMLTVARGIAEESNRLKERIVDLMASHTELVSYGVVVDSVMLKLPDFLNLAQRDHLEWVRQLKDAVNIETKFTGNVDPTKGLIGTWLESYSVANEQLMVTHGKFKKQYVKLMKVAQKINGLNAYKEKQRTLNRGIGTTAKIERYFNKLHSKSKTIYTDLGTINKQKHEQMSASVRSINSQLHELIAIAGKEMDQALEDTDNAKKQGTTMLLVLTVLAVIFGIVLGTLVSRFMSKKILTIANATKEIAAGDLRKDIEMTSNDELGDLAQDTNSMISNLRQIIGQILSFSGKLSTQAEDLGGVSRDFDKNADELEVKSSQANDATSTMHTSMLDISTLANDSMQRVQSVATATEEMNATISEIAQNTEQARAVTSAAVETVENTTNKMNELSEAAAEIGQVADVIVSIAEQTNLLSLNATIEAARAGEAGKGFAVVANEVKELASQTNTATEDIREKISAIQESSNMTIAEITQISKVINEINSIVVVIAGAVEEQAVTTKQISEDINSVSDGIEGMTEHVDSATAVSDEVALNIDHVKNASVNIGQGSNHIQGSVTELEVLADELNQIVGQFKI